MSQFCVQCGHELSEDAMFCIHCGAKLNSDSNVQNATAPAPAGTIAPAKIPNPKRKLSAGKIFLIVVGVLAIFGGLCVAEAVYMMHRIDVNNTKSSAASSGLSDSPNADATAANAAAQALSSPGSGDDSSSEAKDAGSSGTQKDACSLVSREEVGDATGTPVAQASPNEDKDLCTYTPSDGDIAVVTVQVNWHGGKVAMSALPVMTQSAIGKDIRQPVSGIGDEAYILGVDEKTQKSFDDIPEQFKALASFATGPLMFRKGDIWVTVTATLAKNKADAEKKIASLAVDRL
jgi:hypothetical protein